MAAEKSRWTVGAGNVASEPTFDTVIRGYHRRDVDNYTQRAETQINALISERRDNQAQIRILTDQLHQVQSELAERHRHVPGIDEPLRFRHLGLRVEEILQLAEDQAETITAEASAEATKLRTEAQRHLDETRERTAKATRDCEAAVTQRKQEADRNAEKSAVGRGTRLRLDAAQRLHNEAEAACGRPGKRPSTRSRQPGPPPSGPRGVGQGRPDPAGQDRTAGHRPDRRRRGVRAADPARRRQPRPPGPGRDGTLRRAGPSRGRDGGR